MKTLLVFLSFLLLTPSLQANELNTQIDKACMRHSISLVARLKSDVVGEMDAFQSEKALKLATQSCEAYFKKEFGLNPDAVTQVKENRAETLTENNTDNEDNDDSSVSDWFKSEPKKDGHKRIDRRAR